MCRTYAFSKADGSLCAKFPVDVDVLHQPFSVIGQLDGTGMALYVVPRYWQKVPLFCHNASVQASDSRDGEETRTRVETRVVVLVLATCLRRACIDLRLT